jgi:hypothetical protein
LKEKASVRLSVHDCATMGVAVRTELDSNTTNSSKNNESNKTTHARIRKQCYLHSLFGPRFVPRWADQHEAPEYVVFGLWEIVFAHCPKHICKYLCMYVYNMLCYVMLLCYAMLCYVMLC